MHHYNLFLKLYIWINLSKDLVKNKEMILKKEVIDIQTSGYNGVHTEVRNM